MAFLSTCQMSLGTVFVWFQSNLRGSSQAVKIYHSKSDPILAIYGVPQGSVQGPILLYLYTTPHYADGNQSYLPTTNSTIDGPKHA